MKLTTTTQVSVDGVMQGNGPSEVERKAGFERDGWAMGHFDSEAMTFVEQLYQAADAFLFGRWTYDFFAGYWGAMDLGSGPIADALNTRPKYVASNTLTEPRWADTTVLSGDLAAAVGELKATPGGSGSPARRPRSRRLVSPTGYRPRRISRPVSPASSPSCSSSSTRATWRPAPTPIRYVTT
jgi:dihydrofolate reductase